MKKYMTILLLTIPFATYSTLKKPKVTPQRWVLNKPQLERDIKNLFLTQYVHEQVIHYTPDDWLRIAQGNPFLSQQIQDINYECLCYCADAAKYKNFCETYGITYQSMSDMEKITN